MARQVINLGTPPTGVDGDTERTAWDKTNQNFSELYSNASFSTGYIDGFRISYSGASSLTISAGSAYIPATNKIATVVNPIVKSGITAPANTWLHCYLFESSPGVYDIEIVTTVPSAQYSATARTKSGDTSRRYIGSALSSSANTITKFVHNHANGHVTYLVDTAPSPFLVLSGGTSVTPATVNAGGVAPMTASSIVVSVLNLSASSYVRLSNSDGPDVSTGYIAIASPNSVTVTPIPVNASQAYTYRFDSAPSGDTYHRVFGYIFER